MEKKIEGGFACCCFSVIVGDSQKVICVVHCVHCVVHLYIDAFKLETSKLLFVS